MYQYLKNHPAWHEISRTTEVGRLDLRAPDSASDIQIQASIRWLLDDRVTKYLGIDLGDELINEASERERLNDLVADTDEYTWMIYLDGIVIGNVGLNAIQDQSEVERIRACRRVIVLDPKFQGRGIAHVVLDMVNDWAFAEGGFEMIVSRIKPDNSASLKMALRAGSMPYEPSDSEGWLWFKITRDQWSRGAKQ
jgi:RimJ/RimL family protein N-acetyltransferase